MRIKKEEEFAGRLAAEVGLKRMPASLAWLIPLPLCPEGALAPTCVQSTVSWERSSVYQILKRVTSGMSAIPSLLKLLFPS